MSDPIRERFAKEHGFTDQEVRDLILLAKTAARFNERECNGDPHRGNPDPTDKNENARLWGRDLEEITKSLCMMAEPKGYRVEYTGLRPCLRDAAGRWFDIPH